MRNIEIKARLRDVAAARQTAQRLCTSRLGTQHQVDTYFHCAHGRLKLREIDGAAAQLVWYDRPDQGEPKGSDYTLAPVVEPRLLGGALTAACGVRAVVDKRREIFLVDNVRIHLDEVVGLGTFLEFEAVLSESVDEAAGHAQVKRLMAAFGITPADLLTGSYGEMLGQT